MRYYKSLPAVIFSIGLLFSVPVFELQAQTNQMTNLPNGGAANFPNSLPGDLLAAANQDNSEIGRAMLACDAKAALTDQTIGKFTDWLSKNKRDKKGSKNGKDLGSGSCGDSSRFTCDLNCTAPNIEDDGGSCDAYFVKIDGACPDKYAGKESCSKHVFIGSEENLERKESVSNEEESNDGEKDWKQDKANLSNYLKFQNFKLTDCAKKDEEMLVKEYNTFQCKAQALSSVVSKASFQLQDVLGKNATSYGKMAKFVEAVNTQIAQVDEILGGDPTHPGAKNQYASQYAGLLGMENKLETNIVAWQGRQGQFTESIRVLKNDTLTNDQTLEAERMSVVMSCFVGTTESSDNSSRRCYKRVMAPSPGAGGGQTSQAVDEAGNPVFTQQLVPCGGYEYVRSLVYQSCLGAGTSRTSSQVQNAQGCGQDLDSVLQTFNLFSGALTPKSGDAQVAPPVTSESKMMEMVMPRLQNLQNKTNKTGLSVVNEVRSLMHQCFNDSNNWKKDQVKSTSSRYGLKKAGIDTNTTKLRTDFANGFQELNKEYMSANSLLYHTNSPLKPNGCGSPDLDKMSDCYTNTVLDMQNLLNGTGPVAMTPGKYIDGGAGVPGFTVSCKGIKGCIQTYNNIRTAKKDQSMAASKATADFVNKGNENTDNALKSLAGGLSGYQNQVTEQFRRMQEIMAKLGMDSSVELKRQPTEALKKAMIGNPQTPSGPYEKPNSMTNILSGMVPGGLLNFQDLGASDALKTAHQKTVENKAKINEDIKQYEAVQKKLSNIKATCQKDDSRDGGKAGGENAGVINEKLCMQLTEVCTVARDGTPLQGVDKALTSIIDLMGDRIIFDESGKGKLNSEAFEKVKKD